MKKNHLTILPIILIVVLSVISCKKEPSADPNQTLIDQMKLAADSVIKNVLVPSLATFVVDHKRGIDWLHVAGISNQKAKALMDISHTFRITSCTKTFTLTALFQLVDEGNISLNDKFSEYYLEYPASDSITVLMLSNMTNGINNYFNDDHWQNSMKTTPFRIWAPKEFADISFSHPLEFRPDAKYRYSNVNTITIGMTIEKVMDNFLESEIGSHIIKLQPLTNSGFLRNRTKLSGIHRRGCNLGRLDLTSDFTESFNLSNCWAAESVYTTPHELQAYTERIVKGKFPSDSLQYRRLNYDFHDTSPIHSYGIGISKLASFYGHNGIIWEYPTSICPDKDYTVIIYHNPCQPSTYAPNNLFRKSLLILYGSSNDT